MNLTEAADDSAASYLNLERYPVGVTTEAREKPAVHPYPVEWPDKPRTTDAR